MVGRDAQPQPTSNLSRQGSPWLIVGILLVGLVAWFALGGGSDPGCGESPPYAVRDARVCLRLGYEGPMGADTMLDFLDLPLDEVEELAAERDWTVYVLRRDDGLDPDTVSEAERYDRFGVELKDDLVVRIWPG